MGRYDRLQNADEYVYIPGAEGSTATEVTVRRIMQEVKPQFWSLVLATVALFLAAISSLTLPAITGSVIDIITTNSQSPGTDEESRLSALKDTIFLFVLASLGTAVFGFVRSYLFTIAGEKLVAGLRKKLFSAILQQEIGFFDQSRTGELISRLAGDINALKDAATSNIAVSLRWSATIIGGIAYLLYLSWKLTFLVLAIVPIISIAARLYGKYTKKLSKQTRNSLAEATEVAEESISSIRTVRSFANEERQESVYYKKIDTTYTLGVKSSVASGLFIGGTSLVTTAAFAVIIYYGGSLVITGEMTSGDLTSFILYTLTIAQSLSGLAGVFGSMMSAVGANDRVFHLIDRVPLVPREGGGVLEDAPVSIDFENVSFSYPSRPNVNVLNDVSFCIPAGSVAAFVGPSGGGKSTIFSLIERFYDPESGTVLVNGKPLKQLCGASVRRGIGVVLQEPTLLAVSIEENITFGKPHATREEMENAAKIANAHDFITALPEGYDTMVGERGIRLSGGQKQRIAIARAVLQNPSILLLDEATSALDAESEHLVKEALERLMVGRTVCIIAHRLSTVKQAQVVFVIEGGRVVGKGTHEELIEGNDIYANLVRRQLLSDNPDASHHSDLRQSALSSE